MNIYCHPIFSSSHTNMTLIHSCVSCERVGGSNCFSINLACSYCTPSPGQRLRIYYTYDPFAHTRHFGGVGSFILSRGLVLLLPVWLDFWVSICAIDWQNALEKSSITNGNFSTFAKTNKTKKKKTERNGQSKQNPLSELPMWGMSRVAFFDIFMSQLINKINFI